MALRVRLAELERLRYRIADEIDGVRAQLAWAESPAPPPMSRLETIGPEVREVFLASIQVQREVYQARVDGGKRGGTANAKRWAS